MSLFTAIDTAPVPSVFPRMNHPMPPPDNPGAQPVHTNKFYCNMLLDGRNLYAYPLPYSVWNSTAAGFLGLAVSHADASQRVFGPNPDQTPAQYYFSPTGIMSMCLGATQFASQAPQFSTNSWGPCSVVAQYNIGSGVVKYPVVNGMGFVTGVYTGLQPVVSSQVGFRSVGSSQVVRQGVSRTQVVLENNAIWNIYVSSPSGGFVGVAQQDPQHLVVNSTESNLVVQIAKLGSSDWSPTIDSAAGAYATAVHIDGGVTSDYGVATYALHYNLTGSSTGNGTLVYAAPHHVESFTSTMNGKVTNYQLMSPAIGNLTLCVTTVLEMYELLPRDVGFLPWSVNKPVGDSQVALNNFSQADIEALYQAAQNETANVDIPSATNLSSMYFSGKVIDKFALVLLVAKYIIRNDALAQQLLGSLKTAFATFTANKQQTPLFYDQSWKGLVSQAGISDAMADFGNTYYNDHHFHYGYFIHAAAVVGKVDKDFGGTWANDNKAWVNSLVRDIATYGSDTTFPESRNFDWFQGHALAKGLFASADGKDEESSSEDYHAHYGMKLWGNVIGDKAMEARGGLILAIERRAMNHYMLFSPNNTTEPAQILPNFVSGIKFENKIDHTTYFGNNLEYIQGIHMIPITPISSLIRGPAFVQAEWNAIIGNLVNNVDSGWKGILQLNRALFDPQSAYAFFSQPNFPAKWLDDGMSLTWSLAFAKALC